MKKTRSLAHGGLCLLLASLALCANAEVDSPVREALDAMAQGNAQKAYDTLAPHEEQRAGDTDFDMAFGMAANLVGQYTRAIMAFERVLASNPSNAQARAELGRALFAVGDRRAARLALNEGKLQGIPVAAGENIDQLLQAVDRVDAAGRSSYKGYVEVGVGHDTNVNSGPEQRNFAVPAFGGAIQTLNPSGVATHANFGMLGAGFSGRYVLDPRWSAIGNLTGSVRMHGNDASEFDVGQADGNLGLSYRVERDEYTVVAQGGTYDIDNARVRNLYGVVGEWTYRLDGFRQFNTYVQLSRLSYPQQHIADADRTVLGFTYAHLLRNGFLGYGGLYLGKEEERASGVPYLGHRLAGARAGVQHPLSANVAAYATVSYENRRFGGTDPLFLVGRHDRQTNASLGLSWVPLPVWRVTPQVAWVQTRSNVGIAAFDKTVYSVVVRRDF
jgi:tetratricopeptide (TPR) repeat protein